MRISLPPNVADALNDGFLQLLGEVQSAAMTRVALRIASVPLPARTHLQAAVEAKRLALRSPFVSKLYCSLAFDLGVRDLAIFHRLNNAAIFGILHSTLLDDIVDNRGVGQHANLRNIYLTHLMFNFYVEEWLQIRGPREAAPCFVEFVKFEAETYAALFEEELRHVDASNSFASKNEISFKCSPIKAIVSELLKLTGRGDLEVEIFSIVERGSYALCVFDDMLDWQEDYDRFRFTYPLQLALETLGLKYEPAAHDKIKLQLLRTLCYGTLYHEIMKDLVDTIASCATASEGISPKLAYWFYELQDRMMNSWSDHVRFLESASRQ